MRAKMRPTKPLIPLQAVAAALRRFMPEPVLAKIGQKRMMLMTLTTCVQQHGLCTYDLGNRKDVMQVVMLLQAVAAALRRLMPEPVLVRIGHKRTMLMILTSCAQQHGFCAAKMESSRSIFLGKDQECHVPASDCICCFVQAASCLLKEIG